MTVVHPRAIRRLMYDDDVGAPIDAVTPDLKLKLHRGSAALALAARREFRDAWRDLHRACPWSTVFQDLPFADTWYRCYRERFAPVIVTGWTEEKLTGLFLLAVSHDGTTLCHV